MSLFQIDFGNEDKPHKVVGIDLGTTNSLVAFMDLTAPKVIPGADGNPIVPSVVSIPEHGEPIVGAAAVERLITHPDRTIYSVKRLMGRGVSDVQDELKLFPFHIDEGSESVIQLSLGGKRFTPPGISAQVLRQLKRNAEAYLGEPVDHAVITVCVLFKYGIG